MPKLSVVLGYYERPSQLKVTLDSYVHWYSGRDYEFVIVNDGSKIQVN
jgi:glycosyltransferase involved in cell wall biosynthesis